MNTIYLTVFSFSGGLLLYHAFLHDSVLAFLGFAVCWVLTMRFAEKQEVSLLKQQRIKELSEWKRQLKNEFGITRTSK